MRSVDRMNRLIDESHARIHTLEAKVKDLIAVLRDQTDLSLTPHLITGKSSDAGKHKL